MERLTYLCFGFIFFFAESAFAEWLEQSCAFRHRISVTIAAGGSGHSDEIRMNLPAPIFRRAMFFQ